MRNPKDMIAQIEKMGKDNLSQQQEIRGLQEILTRLGDDLVNLGTDASLIRDKYWDGYMTPEERLELKKA